MREQGRAAWWQGGLFGRDGACKGLPRHLLVLRELEHPSRETGDFKLCR